jgi:hypothetical protein
MRLVTALRPGRIAVSITTAIMTVALGAGPAAAAVTWSVTPGGPFTGHAGTTKLKDTTDGNSLDCSSSVLSGRVKSGSGLSGANIGSITGGGKFTGCTGQFPLGYTITLRGLPWHVSVTSDHSGVIHGTISHIEITASLPACHFTIDGTAGGAFDGIVQFSYSNSAHTLKLLPTGTNLRYYKVSGCAGLINRGDSAAYLASYTLSPGQTITGP